MQFACHTWGFNDRPLKEALATIARLGFRYADIGSGPHIDVVQAAEEPKQVAKTIREHLDRYNLQLSDLYLMLPRITVEDADRRAHERKSFEALIPFAVALGTPGITVSPGLRGQGDPDDAFARAVTALVKFVKLATEHDLPVSIEPHLDSIAQTPDEALDILDAVDGLQLTLDWSHLVTQGIRPDAATTLLPRVRHVQVRQAAPMRMQTPFNQGVLDLERVMTLLLSAGYDGIVAVEHMQTEGWHGATAVDPVIEAITTRDALRDLRDHLQTT
ncbi:MAG: sugar phosphate isomerase/epimerase [Chloroflexota bacterium]